MKTNEKMPYVIIRTYSAGVHVGHLKSSKPSNDGYYEVTLENTRRLWSWAGANTLSDLAVNGSKKPNDCKFTLEVPRIDLMAIEIIHTTQNGEEKLKSIPVWELN